MARRALVVLVLASLFAPALAGCGGRENRLRESRRLIDEGKRLRMEGFQTGNEKRLQKGEKMVAKGERMREAALSGM